MPRTQANLNVLRERFTEIMRNQKVGFRGVEISPLLAKLGLDDSPDKGLRRSTYGAVFLLQAINES